MNPLEEGSELTLDFAKLKKVAHGGEDVVPVVVQDVVSHHVLMVAYANEKALRHTLENRLATFWSTSRQELWIKGATSGDQLRIEDVRVNCEQNSLLYRVRLQSKGMCHTKDSTGQTRPGCFYRKIENGRLVFVQS